MSENKPNAHDCANCPTRHTTEWRDLGQRDLASINQAKRTRRVAAGENLYFQGDQSNGVYCIQSGLIGLRRIDENGNSALIKTNATGTTVGYRAFLSKEPHSDSAEVLIPGEVCFIEGSTISRLLKENVGLGERFLQRTITDLKELEDNYSRSLTMDVKQRFLHLIMVYYQQSGFINSNGTPTVDIPVTRADMAQLLGIQPESMSRTVKKVQTDNLLEINNRRITITNMEHVILEAGIAA